MLPRTVSQIQRDASPVWDRRLKTSATLPFAGTIPWVLEGGHAAHGVAGRTAGADVLGWRSDSEAARRRQRCERYAAAAREPGHSLQYRPEPEQHIVTRRHSETALAPTGRRTLFPATGGADCLLKGGDRERSASAA